MLKPNMFCDVIRLRPSQEEEERKIKSNILKQAETEVQFIDFLCCCYLYIFKDQTVFKIDISVLAA